jgi:hypothetical protein
VLHVLVFGRAFPRLGRNHTTVGTPRPIPFPGRPEYRPLQLHSLQLLCLQSPVESRTPIPSLYIFITPAPSTRNRPCLSSPPALPEHTPRLCYFLPLRPVSVTQIISHLDICHLLHPVCRRRPRSPPISRSTAPCYGYAPSALASFSPHSCFGGRVPSLSFLASLTWTQ